MKKERNVRKGSRDVQRPPPRSAATGTIVIGTYEGALLGLQAGSGVQIFGYAPHTGCIKTLACNSAGRMATGGTDHVARTFDLAKGVELGEITEHDDTVSCVEFWGATNFLTAGNDGQVCIWRQSDWEMLLKFRAHKQAVAQIAVHPAGRLMASAGRDATVRLWDLTRGTSAANVPTNNEVYEVLQWSPSGNRLLGLSTKELCVIDVAGSGRAATYRDPEVTGLLRVTLCAAVFLREGDVLLGDAKGNLKVVNFVEGQEAQLAEVCQLPGDEDRVRIKAIVAGASDKDGQNLTIAVGTTTGRVEVWQFTAPEPGAPLASSCFNRVRAVETNVRLTSMTYWHGDGHAIQAADESDDAEDVVTEIPEEPVSAKKRQKKSKQLS